MKENSRFPAGIIQMILRIILYISLIICWGSCNNPGKKLGGGLPTHGSPYDSNAIKWLDWNVLFNAGTNAADRNQAMDSLSQYITDYINNYNINTGSHFAVDQYVLSCPCDSSLWNLSAIPVMGSGQAPILPPPPKSGGGLGGNGDAIAYVNQNNSFTVDSTMSLYDSVQTNAKIHLDNSGIDKSKILAVMDTGLDSTLFEKRFAGLLWNAPNGRTLRNFQFFNNGLALDYYFDDEKNKHGTAVTAIALQAMEGGNPPLRVKPRIMVLKVLDHNKKGSTFTVSCALSYAIQQHATLINASLGYYSKGETDSVLQYYAGLADSASPNPIPVLAAAGNLPGRHDMPLCGDPHPGNELSAKRLFYPACFSTKYTNVISVTGLRDPQSSCFYQNYSNTYISIGVVTNPGSSNCCRFPVEFLKSGYEGSSFATPVISGKIMGCLLGTAGAVPRSCLDLISNTQSVKQVTVQGRYFTYTSPPLP